MPTASVERWGSSSPASIRLVHYRCGGLLGIIAKRNAMRRLRISSSVARCASVRANLSPASMIESSAYRPAPFPIASNGVEIHHATSYGDSTCVARILGNSNTLSLRSYIAGAGLRSAIPKRETANVRMPLPSLADYIVIPAVPRTRSPVHAQKSIAVGLGSPVRILTNNCSSAAWMIWHGYDLSALLFLAPLLSSRRTAEWFFAPERARRRAATKFKRRDVRSDDAVDRPPESYSWPV